MLYWGRGLLNCTQMIATQSDRSDQRKQMRFLSHYAPVLAFNNVKVFVILAKTFPTDIKPSTLYCKHSVKVA